MPIYEFECAACGHRFEYLVRTSNEEIACPKCKRSKIKRLISSFSFSSKDPSGMTTSSSAGCSGCSGGNCSSCHG